MASFVEKVRVLAFEDLALDGRDYDSDRAKLEDARDELVKWYHSEKNNKKKSPQYTKALKKFREAWYNVFKTQMPVNSEQKYLDALGHRKHTKKM